MCRLSVLLSVHAVWLAWCADAISAEAVPQLGDDPSIDQLNQLLAGALPEIVADVRKEIPASYGACSWNNDRRRRRRRTPAAPQPCSGGDSQWLFYKHKSWAYKVIARWIGGLKTIDFTSAVASRITSAPGLELKVNGVFAGLPLSLNINECFTFDQCSSLWDNAHACCGSNKHFSVSAGIYCTKNGGPLDHLEVNQVVLDKLEITESLGGVHIHVEDITNKVRDEVSKQLTAYLTTKKIFPGPNGAKVNLVDYLNGNQQIAGVAQMVCSQVQLQSVKV